MSETDEMRDYWADQIADEAERRLAALHDEKGEECPLKPCPFCGGEARTWKYSHPTLGEYWRVACNSDLSDCCISGRADTEAEAIAAWNTRHERTCKPTTKYKVTCSECGSALFTFNGKLCNYCPNCGRRVVE
jgi:Lar family restriction alleviation protein